MNMIDRQKAQRRKEDIKFMSGERKTKANITTHKK